ncbi:F-box protein [Rhynchospora pubera]|uniref:F-box protein n=1 Tax=Rhynchospora pubera TaxID=906938 RepID=A0AAV8GDY7_9POAL|nr:F-box protein [Rhynchospora pubera]
MEQDAFSSPPINSLPEECVSHVISLTSPRDACIFSLASTGFRSAVDSDTTWQRFLPSDYVSILSRAVDPVAFSSKKDLFFKLCERHVLIDGGKMSFGLDRSSGAKCYMISAKALEIAHVDAPQRYWRWVSLRDSRFDGVAELIEVCWLEITGKIDSRALSAKTRYGAYLVYKLTETACGLGCPIGKIKQQASVSIGRQISKSTVCLQTFHERYIGKRFRKWRVPHETVEFSNGGAGTPKERGDGWKEVELGTFYNENGEDGVVEMSLREINGLYWKSGLIVQGIEIRPKH